MAEENPETGYEGMEQQQFQEQTEETAYQEIGAESNSDQQILIDAQQQQQEQEQQEEFQEGADGGGGGEEMENQNNQQYESETYDENFNNEQAYDPNKANEGDIPISQIQPEENRRDYTGNENYEKLTQFGIHDLVAGELVEMFDAGNLNLNYFYLNLNLF